MHIKRILQAVGPKYADPTDTSDSAIDSLCGSILSDNNIAVEIAIAVLPYISDCIYDASTYPIPPAMYASKHVPCYIRESVIDVVTSQTPCIFTHPVGVYVAREFALRGVDQVISELVKHAPSISHDPVGRELLQWTVHLEAIANQIANHWSEYVYNQDTIELVHAALAMSSAVNIMFDDIILCDEITGDATEEVMDLLALMAPKLDHARSMSLCQKMISSSGTMLQWLQREHESRVMAILKSSQSIVSILYVDHLRAKEDSLRKISASDEILQWANANMGSSDALIATVPFGGDENETVMIQIDDVRQTRGLELWITNTTIAQLCMKGVTHCPKGSSCEHIHVSPHIFASFVPVEPCCKGHDDTHRHTSTSSPSTSPNAASVLSLYVPIRGGLVFELPSHCFHRTQGFTAVKEKKSHNQHQQYKIHYLLDLCPYHGMYGESCPLGQDCEKIHVCKDIQSMIRNNAIDVIPHPRRSFTNFRADLNGYTQSETYKTEKDFLHMVWADNMAADIDAKHKAQAKVAIMGLMGEAHRLYTERKMKKHNTTVNIPLEQWKCMADDAMLDLALHGCEKVKSHLSCMSLFVGGDEAQFYGLNELNRVRRRNKQEHVLSQTQSQPEIALL